MGVEIVNVTMRLLKEENKSNIPQRKEDFFKYLIKSLNTEKAAYYRNIESGTIKIPKAKKQKYKNADNILKMEESNLGRKLTFDERSQCITRWNNNFDINEYITIYKSKYIYSTSPINIAGKKDDPLNSIVTLIYTENISNNPLDEYLFTYTTEIICKAIKTVLEKKQERARDCYRSLLTLRCIDNFALYSVLDQEIIETYQKNKVKPKQYEIYQKYHPTTKKDCAEASASKMLKDFFKDLKTYLKEKNPEILS
jgi:hypothetical protein